VSKQITNGETTITAVKGLYARFQAEGPKDGTLTLSGDTKGKGDVYTDKAQVTKDMSDPRYSKDAAFRKSVGEKLVRSKAAGTFTGAFK